MAIVKKYAAEIIAVKHIAKGVYTLDILSLSKPFKYYPGQFLRLAMEELDPSTQWPESRCFSMQTASGSAVLRITYAVNGKFTNQMANELKVGSQITVKLPFGDLFTQEHNKENAIFLAGGTGITPFLSLFTDALFTNYKCPILFAGFRNKAMNLYQKELKSAQKINPSLQLNLVYENEDGFVKLGNILDKARETSTFFISGPQSMILFYKQKLIANGVNEVQIKTDEWK